MTVRTRTTPSFEVFADVVCPFTHVGLRRLRAFRHRIGRDDVAVTVRAWPLELVNGEQLDRDLIAEEVEELRDAVATDLFQGFRPEVFPMSSLPALALTASAYRTSPRAGEETAAAVRHALFEQGRDVSDPRELARIRDSLDIEQPTAEDRSTVLADLEEGRARSVVGSPHFFVNRSGRDSIQVCSIECGLKLMTSVTPCS